MEQQYKSSILKTSLKRSITGLLLMIISYNLLGQVPTITSFSPSSAVVGTTVTINGTNFSTTPSNNVVYFGPAKASVSTATATQLTVTVPYGSSYNQIKLFNTTSKSWCTSGKYFLPQTYTSSLITTGSFSQTSFGTSNVDSYGKMVLADFDLDGKTDVLTGGKTAGASVFCWKNSSTASTITMSNAQTLSLSGSTNRMMAFNTGDLNADGYFDIVAVQYNSGTAKYYYSYWLNNATGSSPYFGSEVGPAMLTSTTYAEDIAIADLDKDGKNDIVIGEDYKMIVLLNTSSNVNVPTFTEQPAFTSRNNFRGMLLGDVDNNSVADIIGVGLPSATNSSDVILNQSTPGALSYNTTGGGFNSVLAASGILADINSDGLLDIVVTGLSAGVNIHQNTNSAAGSISFNSSSVAFTRSSGSGYGTDAGDLNGDGKPDIVIATYDNTNGFSIFPNAAQTGAISSASLLAEVKYTIAGTPRFQFARVVDLNNDGNNDIAVIADASFANKLLSFKNNSSGITLPLKFLNFAVKLINENAELTWQTANEINNDRFEIEYSTDGVRYNKIAEKTSQTNTNAYQFIHLKPTAAQNYYRIKQVDVDGKFTYSDIRAVTLTYNASLSAFPNPVLDRLHLYLGNSIIKKGKVKVYDVTGKIITAQDIKDNGNTMLINTSSWPKGIYSLTVLNDNGQTVYNQKIIK